MSLEKKASDFFQLDDQVWMRHSNPLSVWTRFIILPFLALAIWARVWIGWYCLIPAGVLLVWTWYNPRAFNRPRTTKSWASKAVLGERVWIKRKTLPIPAHHLKILPYLNGIAFAGLPLLVWGLYALKTWPVILGLVLVIVGKLWFLDRMVWIFEDMKEKSEEYQSWEY